MNWVESLTKESVFPTSGFNFLARCFARWYVGPLIVFTIGLRGMSSL